jgi:hypothetical protein
MFRSIIGQSGNFGVYRLKPYVLPGLPKDQFSGIISSKGRCIFQCAQFHQCAVNSSPFTPWLNDTLLYLNWALTGFKWVAGKGMFPVCVHCPASFFIAAGRFLGVRSTHPPGNRQVLFF